MTAPPADEPLNELERCQRALLQVRLALGLSRDSDDNLLDVIAAQRAKIVELERDEKEARGWRKCTTHGDVDGARQWGCPDCVAWQRTRIAALESALAPFVAACERSTNETERANMPDERPIGFAVTLGDYRRAEKALT